VGSRGDPEGTYLSRTLAISFCFPPRGAVLRCIGFGLRLRLSSCRRSDRWLSLYPAPCLGLFENYPVSGSVPMGNTWFPSCRRVRYLGDECHIMICSSFWIPGFHGFMTTFRFRVSIAEVHFSEFNPDSSWFLPCSWAALGGGGGEPRGSGGHLAASYTGSFFPLDAASSGGRVPDLHRLPFSTEGNLISSILIPGCAYLVAAF
jgi:hypothetical protein